MKRTLSSKDDTPPAIVQVAANPRRAKTAPRPGRRALAAALLWGLLAAVPPAARAELYRWTDEAGQTHFTDNLFNVPQKHLPQIKTFREMDGPGSDDIPLARGESGYMVEVLLAGTRKARLVVDTGATATVIAPEVLRALGVAVSHNPPITVRTANGETRAGWAELSSLEVGPHKRGPIRVVAHDAVAGADGLLGMDFLGSFRVEILTAGPVLRLSPP